MGRKRTKHQNLPDKVRARVRGKRTYYYLDTGGKPRTEIPLGSDYLQMLVEYAKHECTPKVSVYFRDVAKRYQVEIIPTKAPRTQLDNIKEIAKLIEFFGDGQLDDIEPLHVYQYLDWRKAPVRANREKALLSHIFTKAMRWGLTSKPNPCRGVEGHKETGRDIYVEDDEYNATWNAADVVTRDAMDLIYLLGQRVDDVLKALETDIKGNHLHIQQGKTGTKLRFVIKGQLRAVIDRIMARKSTYRVRSLHLVVSEKGQPLTMQAIEKRFRKARTAAGTDFQLRDLRPKALTDKTEETDSPYLAQKQAGHANVSMTEEYLRNRRGDKVEPTR